MLGETGASAVLDRIKVQIATEPARAGAAEAAPRQETPAAAHVDYADHLDHTDSL